jgi:glycosidase
MKKDLTLTLFLAAFLLSGSVLRAAPSRAVADWIRDAVIYRIDPKTFSKDGRIQDVEPKLLALKSFGFPCVLISSIQPVGVSTSPVHDWMSLKQESGTKDGLKALMDEAHLNGLKVILEWNGCALAAGNPELELMMARAMEYWVREFGMDGFFVRDAESLGTVFWEEMRDRLEMLKPGGMLLAADSARSRDSQSAFHASVSSTALTVLSQIVQGEKKAFELFDALGEEAARFPEGALRIRPLEGPGTARAAARFLSFNAPCTALLFTLDGLPMFAAGEEAAEKRPEGSGTIDWKGEVNGKPESLRMKKLVRRLLSVRQAHPALSRGQTFRVETDAREQAVVFARSYRDDALLVAVNLSSAPLRSKITLPEIFLNEGGQVAAKTLLKTGRIEKGTDGTATLLLPAFGYEIWKVQ